MRDIVGFLQLLNYCIFFAILSVSPDQIKRNRESKCLSEVRETGKIQGMANLSHFGAFHPYHGDARHIGTHLFALSPKWLR
jgi:hypothetical protein